MLKVAIRRILPDKVQKLEAWLRNLNSRADEVRATFVDETIRGEQAYILQGIDGPLLVYVMEAEDFDKGAKAYANSMLPIDLEHHAVMDECLGESLGLRPICDISLEERPPPSAFASSCNE